MLARLLLSVDDQYEKNAPVPHDQHRETHSLDPWLIFNITQNWGPLK